MVKLYVSGSFYNKGQIGLFMKELVNMGHEITYPWVSVPSKLKNREVYNKAADDAFKGIQDCDALIAIFSDSKSSFRGIFTEIGIALGMGKKVFIFNSDNMTVLTWLPSERIETNIYYQYYKRVKVFKHWVDLVAELEKL